MNRLAREASPYLAQHGDNPVDWYPWGDEALSRARELDRPIFLSIGYSACHWCHVMERESFEDEAVAAVLNERFVSIKVDREERPDLDQVYQLVVQLMGRNGGWPLSVFLTPDQKPFFGGTYFPPTDKPGMPSFVRVLHALADAYANERDAVVKDAAELSAAIANVSAGELAARGEVDDVLGKAARLLVTRCDERHGGFGVRPKFPNTMALGVLLRYATDTGEPASRRAVRRALDGMRDGGIHDHVGGGFHRYSTDERWLVPHFEKMLYDNALLLRLYADAWRAYGDTRDRDTALRIADYLARDMTDTSGALHASEDADSEGEEGAFYVWTKEAFVRALHADPDALAVAERHHGVTAEGNFEGSGRTVLSAVVATQTIAAESGAPLEVVDAALSRAHARLAAVRAGRPRPFRDTKILASWNALFVGAAAVAGGAFGDATLVERARRAFDVVTKKLVVTGGGRTRVLRHVKGDEVRGPGFLDDHAYLADAALDLFDVTGDGAALDLATGVAETIVLAFEDRERGGFHFVADDHEKLLVRPKDTFDHAVPNAGAVAARVLHRLATLKGEPWTEAAARSLRGLGEAAVAHPLAMAETVLELDATARGSTDVVIVGLPGTATFDAMVATALRAPAARRSVVRVDESDPDAAASMRAACPEVTAGKTRDPSRHGDAVAYVCRGRTCSAPITTAVALGQELARGVQRGE
ncbi:MAG: thioredoxin domain-containing protein [Polyangiaceae bacterium]